MAKNKQPKLIKSFTVDRERWLNGAMYMKHAQKHGTSAQGTLYDNSDQMCVLGFYARASGVPKAELLLKDSPKELKKEHREKLHPKVRRIAALIYGTNDDVSITSQQREEKLKKYFARAGIKLNFIGRPTSVKKQVL